MMPSYSLVFVQTGVENPAHLLLTQPNGHGDTWYHTKDKQIVGADKAQTQGKPFVANFLFSLGKWGSGGWGLHCIMIWHTH